MPGVQLLNAVSNTVGCLKFVRGDARWLWMWKQDSVDRGQHICTPQRPDTMSIVEQADGASVPVVQLSYVGSLLLTSPDFAV
jgi:hypothetical protein